jgi:hypothetical protein
MFRKPDYTEQTSRLVSVDQVWRCVEAGGISRYIAHDPRRDVLDRDLTVRNNRAGLVRERSREHSSGNLGIDPTGHEKDDPERYQYQENGPHLV